RHDCAQRPDYHERGSAQQREWTDRPCILRSQASVFRERHYHDLSYLHRDRSLMRLRHFTLSFVIVVCFLAAAQTTSAQALDISSGGLPTITGAVSGSVSGSADVRNDLVVTINFGEVSPMNTNAIVKVVVPIALRSNQPYQVAVSMSGLNNANAEAVQ